ncbi:MAG: pyridoxal phosphate-dependent aminotransferase [Balneolaceae bacterium]|nr:MAG: pyridoxal phosphate-dependent aminotransferase [Balneolaceae bacterium]
MPEKIYLSPPHMGGNEKHYVGDAFESNWIAPLGPNVDGFEHDLAEYTGTPHVAALTSGTAALHLGLILSGVSAGDEVICQSFTFSASANPIVYLGAKPVFVDSEKLTWNMDPELLEQAILDRIKKTGRTPKAIVPVHLYGMPAQMGPIMQIADRYGISVIEDAAEALGSHIDGKMCGTFGRFGILSFNGNKIITTSGGGALIGSEEAMIRKARFLATQARDPAPHYEHSEIGYNYRLSNVCAGIGRGQMEVLPERINRRRDIFEHYRKTLCTGSADQAKTARDGSTRSAVPDNEQKHAPFVFLPEPEGYFSNRWLTTLLVIPGVENGVTREDIRLALEAEQIEARPLWKPMHMQPVFGGCPYYGNGVSDYLFKYGLCLPSGTAMTGNDLDRITGMIQHITDKILR